MRHAAAVMAGLLIVSSIAHADPGSGSGSDSTEAAAQAAELARERQQVSYDYDHAEHVDRANKRSLGHLELLIGAVLAVGGTALFVTHLHDGTPAAIGGGLGLAGICSLAVGTVTTIQGADPYPVIPPPAPVAGRAIGAQWAWTF